MQKIYIFHKCDNLSNQAIQSLHLLINATLTITTIKINEGLFGNRHKFTRNFENVIKISLTSEQVSFTLTTNVFFRFRFLLIKLTSCCTII